MPSSLAGATRYATLKLISVYDALFLIKIFATPTNTIVRSDLCGECCEWARGMYTHWSCRDNVLCLPGNYVVTRGPDRSAVAADSSQLTCLRPLSQVRRLNGDSQTAITQISAANTVIYEHSTQRVIKLKRFAITERKIFAAVRVDEIFLFQLVVILRRFYFSLIFKRLQLRDFFWKNVYFKRGR